MHKILIVDDEPLMRQLIEQTLEGLEDGGVELLTAEDGISAVETIKRERPDIVFLDVMMPKMNGFEVCNIVKNELLLRSVYVIMLTAKGQEFDKQKAREVGADAYITKPFKVDEIYDKAIDVLRIRPARES
ncbi:MAG: response regulator [Chloroflexota bacterium]